MFEQESGVKLFKGRYLIVFYDKTDEVQMAMFDNIHEICKYKKLEATTNNYNLVKVELYRALRRPDHKTLMLTGELMRVYLIDTIDEDEEKEFGGETK